jgi:hypothetical protein
MRRLAPELLDSLVCGCDGEKDELQCPCVSRAEALWSRVERRDEASFMFPRLPVADVKLRLCGLDAVVEVGGALRQYHANARSHSKLTLLH